jgi:uncharacterized protein (TIGR03435 family)
LKNSLGSSRNAFADRRRRTVKFPNLFGDMQSQLGLKIVSDRARLPYFLVEHAAAPTPN